MDNKKVLMASEARKITEQSDFLLKNTYRWIRDSASRNTDRIPLDKCDYDEDVFAGVIFELKSNGYTVEEDIESDCFWIKW